MKAAYSAVRNLLGVSTGYRALSEAAIAADPLVPWLERRVAELEAALREAREALQGANTLWADSVVAANSTPDLRSRVDYAELDVSVRVQGALAKLDALLDAKTGVG